MKTKPSSRIAGLYKLTADERLNGISPWLSESSIEALRRGVSLDVADKLVENAVGIFGVPLGVATNFTVDGRDVLVPMAIEEPSVIAAASNAARMVRGGDGFLTEADPPLTVAQIELLDPETGALEAIVDARQELLALADQTQPELVSLGGGAREIEVRTDVGGTDRMVVHLVVDCRDAMGANVVNTMAEAISGRLEELSAGRAGLRILTNLADRRCVRASCSVPFDALARRGFDGETVARGVVAASRFAEADPYRAATHNKGAFNGIDAVLLATGNDWRAVEAGGHAYASRSGRYRPLATWRMEEGRLMGRIELPMAVGIVGGASRSHPIARACLDLLGVETGDELGRVVACAGLASNLAALAALSSEGIQAGHMKLHRRKFDQS